MWKAVETVRKIQNAQIRSPTGISMISTAKNLVKYQGLSIPLRFNTAKLAWTFCCKLYQYHVVVVSRAHDCEGISQQRMPFCCFIFLTYTQFTLTCTAYLQFVLLTCTAYCWLVVLYVWLVVLMSDFYSLPLACSAYLWLVLLTAGLLCYVWLVVLMSDLYCLPLACSAYLWLVLLT